jgi:hypothetical protein
MQTNPHRWFGVGHSSLSDSRTAGAQAAAEAIGGRTPKAVLIFCSISHDLPELLAGVRDEAGPDAEIVGTTTHGELSSDGATLGGVAIAALGGDGFHVRSRAVKIKEHGQRASGGLIAETVRGLKDDYKVLIMLVEGLAPIPHEIIRGAYTEVGATVPLVGGFGGDDNRFEGDFQILNDRVLTGSVVGLALGSDAPIGVGIAHGWHKVGEPMIVSKSQGPHIFKLDDNPALDVLLHRSNFKGTAEEFFKQRGLLQPLGLARRNGEDIRVIHAGDDDERSVWGTAEMTQGSMVWIMEADRHDLINGAAQSCADALSHLEGLAPLGALTFNCAGRRAGLIEGGLEEELAVLRKGLRDAPFAGFYTTGEIARVRGASGMHHLTLVTLALA